MEFGLSEAVIQQIRAVFVAHQAVDEVVLYGSRAKGSQQVGSDIDLCLKGEKVDFALLSKVANELDELPIPYTVDLSIFSTLDNTDLIDHILRVGQTFYKKTA